VEALTTSLGRVTHYYQGRNLEDARIGNFGDSYVINGWEDAAIVNQSGIVDAYRNPKADPSIISYYNQSLYVAVKLRDQVLGLGDTLVSDFFLVNEENVQGDLFLRITTKDEYSTQDEQGFNIKVTGGHTYGEFLQESVRFVPVNPGYYTILAQLYSGDRVVAEGVDHAYVVSYDPESFYVPVAVLDTSGLMQDLLKSSGIRYVESYPNFDSPKEKVILLGGDRQPVLRTESSTANDPMIDWVRRGNTLVIAHNADMWADYFAGQEVLDYADKISVGRNSYPGNFFVREHPLFDGLPVNTAFNWEYQDLSMYSDRDQFGMILAGEECVVGSYIAGHMDLYTAVGIIPLGEGQIILSSLDIVASISEGAKSSVVSKQLLLNFLKYGLDIDDFLDAEDAARAKAE
jgi:hypothetical protein